MTERETSINAPQTGQTAEHRGWPNGLSDDHSELVPLLPIPNRTVKRLSADDSVDYPCESRSSSDSLQDNALVEEGVVVSVRFEIELL